MKFTPLIFLSLLSPTLSSPLANTLETRQTAQSITDNYLFTISLPAFTAHRNARDPPNLIWDSDGCTSSPDNPLNFPFLPACNRHDFGYRNYRAQSRFTVSAKGSIDGQFRTDLYYQCTGVSFSGICRALADVYYTAVRLFGGLEATPGKRDDDLEREYEEKLAIYNQLMDEARANGELPEGV